MRCTVCLKEVGQVRRLSDLKDRRSLRARICGTVSEVPSSWNRLCKTVSRNAYYGSVIIVFIVMSSGSRTSQLPMPEPPRLYTQTLRGAEGRVPWRPALRGGAPNKFCASWSRLCCGGGAAMWGRILRTTFPIIPFTAATLAGGRWLPGVWPFRPPGRFCSSLFWASTMGWRGIPQSRASGDVGNSCPLFPLLHTWDPGPRVGPCGEACSSPAGQGPKDPDVRGSHISSPDTHAAHSAHSPPFPDVPFLLQ